VTNLALSTVAITITPPNGCQITPNPVELKASKPIAEPVEITLTFSGCDVAGGVPFGMELGGESLDLTAKESTPTIDSNALLARYGVLMTSPTKSAHL